MMVVQICVKMVAVYGRNKMTKVVDHGANEGDGG